MASEVNPVTLDKLMAKVMERPESDREAFLRRAVTNDAALLAAALEQLRLISSARRAERFFGRRPDDAVDEPSLLPNTHALRPGERVGGFTLESFLGRGGMGQVWQAKQESLGRRVALKLILPEKVDERTLALFVKEAKAGGRCHHKNLVATLDHGEDEGIAWLAQELVEDACTLADALDRFRAMDVLPSDYYRRVAELIEKVALGMEAAHEAKVHHRDLKPHNILLGADDEPRVADFGLARIESQSIEKSKSGELVGTYYYMSPEQVAAKRIGLDHRTDVFSLGVVLYEMLTLQRPFVGDSGQQIAQQITYWDPPRADQVRSHCPRDLAVIAEKAMQKIATHRYPTMAAFAADLRRYLEDRPILAKPTGRIERARKWVRRNPTVTGVLVTAVVGAVVAVGFMLDAQAQREEADRQRSEAELQTALAQANERKFESKVSEFNQLAGVVRYDELVAGAKDLLGQAAWPAAIPGMESWVQDCDELLEMRGKIEDTIDSLRKDALHWTEAQQEADRRVDAERFAQWELLGKQLASLRYAQAVRDGAPIPAVALTAEQQELDAYVLNSLAWARVAPQPSDRRVWGEEPLGLAAARLLVDKATDDPARFQYLDTLAWALLANGQDAGARQTAAAALDAAPDDAKGNYESRQRNIESAIERAAEILTAAEQEYETMTAAVTVRQTYAFAPKDEAQSFLHDQLVDLLVKFDRLEASERAVIGQRLEWARQIDSLSQSHPNAAVTWAEARNAIGVSEKYAGLTIELRAEDVLGLVPLGPNPKTGYFEFYHLRSAWDGKSDPREIAIPTHGKDGSIEVMDDTGIVFVLLPGGEVTLGSQDKDEDAPYYDAQRYSDEDLHPVSLSPFFLARHELTQGQWSRLWSNEEGLRQPSYYAAGDTVLGTKMTLAHPVEQVDWSMSRGLLASHGLSLPTEAQWEYGCRGGTTTARITPLAELQTVANVADATAKRAVPSWQCETWTDGHVIHAPVGSFQANGFGLYDVHGNVWEWCLDAYSSYGSERVGDGLRPGGDGSSDRVIRGGSFSNPAVLARSASRRNSAPTIRANDLGLRPARTSRLRD